MENGGRKGQDVVKLEAKNDLRRPNLRKRRGEKVNVIGCSHNLLAADIEKSDLDRRPAHYNLLLRVSTGIIRRLRSGVLEARECWLIDLIMNSVIYNVYAV